MTPAVPRPLPRPLSALWRYRAPLAGLTALLLALVAEALLRAPAGAAAANPALGANLLRLAALLVGLVAWVRDGIHLAPRSAAPAAAGTLPVRGAAGRPGAQDPAARKTQRAARAVWTRAAGAYQRARARLGRAGTAVGLLIVAALTAWLLLLLRQDFGHPLAPYVWLAALVALALTFVGLRPAPADASLVPHDPGETPDPPMTRGEWLAIGVILLVTIVVRLWSLETIPMGPYTDEGDRAMDARRLNNGDLVDHRVFIFFGTGWWGVPSLYFWLVAQSMKVFGDTLAGARMIHAIAGIITVWVTYRLGRSVWSPRVGLVAAALIAISDFAIQFSRTAGESTITMLTWALCFYFLYRGLQTRRPIHFALSGLAAGFTLYGYASGKLLPLFLIPVALYILVRWGRTGFRRYLPGLVLLALAAGLTYAPNGLYVLSNPDSFTMRYNGVSILNHANEYQLAYNTDNWGVILARQFQVTFAAFDVGQERGPFYPTGQPVLPVAWAAVWVLGAAYVLWRAGDVRFALLGLWALGGLAGAAFTNDTPTLQRVTAMVPLLGLIPAVFLDRVARGAPPMRRPALRWGRARTLRLAFNALIVALILTLGAQTLSFYFGPYTAAAHYDWYSYAGRYAATLDAQRDHIYQMDVPELGWGMSPAFLLAGAVQGEDLDNVGTALPLTTNEDKNAHFLVFPSMQPYLAILQTYYPGGALNELKRLDGEHFATVYKVAMDQFDAQRQVIARYGPPGGPLFERPEPRIGTDSNDPAAAALRPPAGMAYPLQAQWIGGLRAPAYGAYRMSLAAPGGATLEIDGRSLLTTTVGSTTPVEAPIVLAGGVHQFRLTGMLADANGIVALRWGGDSGLPQPITRPFLWGGPLGVWRGQTFPPPGDPAWLTTAKLPDTAPAPLLERRDGTLAWRDVNSALQGAGPQAALWRATLHTTVAGDYVFDVATDARVTLWIDGRLIGGRQAGPAPLPITAALTAGDHDIEARVITQPQAGPVFELYWQAPGHDRELLPPTAVAPAAGGAWPAAERPGVPTPDPALLAAALPALRVQSGAIIRGPWLEARGVAALPNGGLVVGDTGHSRVHVYRPDGSEAAAWGAPGAGDGLFKTITDVAVSGDGVIATLDTGNHEIQLFDERGAFIRRLPAAQIGISEAMGIAWGPDGKIYVADTSGSRVVRLAPDGAPEASMREAVAPLAPLEQPTDVAVTPDGTLYAVDLRKRVVRFKADGRIDRAWSVPIGVDRGGAHLAVWGSDLVITAAEGNSISALDPVAGTVRAMQSATAAPLNFALPIGVTEGADHRLWVLNSADNSLLALSAEP